MRATFAGLIALVAGLVVQAGGQAQQAPVSAAGPGFSLYVSVLDRRGTPVAAVDPSDLDLRVGGMSADIVSVAPASEPLTIALLVDHCGRSPTDLRRALTTFVNTTAGPHRVSLITMGGAPTELVPYTDEAATLVEAVRRLPRATCLGLHLIEALRELYRSSELRDADRAVVVALVGHPGDAETSDVAPLLTVIRDSGVPLFVVRFPAEVTDAAGEQSNLAALLNEGPVFSGGQRRDVLSTAGLETQLKRLATVLESQYRLEFTLDGTPAASRAYRLEVFATRPDWRVLAPVAIRFTP
jgi:hypothetical protein